MGKFNKNPDSLRNNSAKIGSGSGRYEQNSELGAVRSHSEPLVGSRCRSEPVGEVGAVRSSQSAAGSIRSHREPVEAVGTNVADRAGWSRSSVVADFRLLQRLRWLQPVLSATTAPTILTAPTGSGCRLAAPDGSRRLQTAPTALDGSGRLRAESKV
uniref:Uncharacterized protein n=1 Tax=Anopheles gambiae TaxID=7165 RepID=A0A0E4G8B3_ANOGA